MKHAEAENEPTLDPIQKNEAGVRLPLALFGFDSTENLSV